jgi:hypothetical protein
MRIRRQVNSSAWFSLLCGEIPASRRAIPASSAEFPNCKDFRHSRRREVCAKDHTWRDCGRPGVGRVAERVWHLRDDAAGRTSKGNVEPPAGAVHGLRSGVCRATSRDPPASAALKPTTLSADRAERDPADHQDFVRPCDGPHSRLPFNCPTETTFRFKFP